MSGSKVYVKKPLRRYERSFEEEKAAENNVENSDEAGMPINPDITSPAGIKGPVMSSKKQPLRYKVKPLRAKEQSEEESGDRNFGEKEQ